MEREKGAAMIASADNQPNDAFGYSCYAVVLSATPALTDLVAEIRQLAGMTRAAIPAHVTVKGTFVGVESLDRVKQLVAEHTTTTVPFYVSFDGAKSVWWEGGGALRMLVGREMQALHDRLVKAISPLGTAAYQDDPYKPHMTYAQDLSPEGVETAKDLVHHMDFGPGFTAEAVDLMGRVGPAYGGEWTLIQRFPLGASI